MVQVALVSFLFFFFSHSIFSQTKEPEVAGRVVVLQGEANVRNDLQNKKLKKLKVGDQLYEGETINTSSDGAIKLLMSDKTILDIGPSSLFKLKEYKLKNVDDREVNLEMDYGKVRALVNQKLKDKGRIQIRTKAAVMGVRGTEFIVNAGAPTVSAQFSQSPSEVQIPKTEIVVVSGKVDVTMPQAKQDVSGSENAGVATQPPVVTSLTAGTKMTAVNSPSGRLSQNSNAAGLGRGPSSQPETKVEKLSEAEVSQVKAESSLAQPTLAEVAVAQTESKPKQSQNRSENNKGSGPSNSGIGGALSDKLLSSIGEAVKNSPKYAPNAKDINFRGGQNDLSQLPPPGQENKFQKEEVSLGVVFSY